MGSYEWGKRIVRRVHGFSSFDREIDVMFMEREFFFS